VTGGLLIDGTGRSPLQDAVVTIKGNRIESVGTQKTASLTAGTQLVDARGKTILPGLCDMHLHYKDFFPEMLLHWGVTTVRDMGNDEPVWMIAQREFINRELIYGPRLFTVGISMESRATGHHRCVMTPEDGVETARWLFNKLQVDGVKVYRRIYPEVYQAIAREGLANGKWVAGHLGNVERVNGRRVGLTALEAAEIGIHSLEHGFGIPESAVDEPEEIRELDGVRRDIVCWNTAKSDKLKKVIDILISKNVYVCPTILNRWEEVFPQAGEIRAGGRENLERS
jgi:imidazolonepropionase-like amidohydrolase